MNRDILKPTRPSTTSDNLVDRALIDRCADSVKERRSIELQVTRNLITLIRDAGYEPIAEDMSDNVNDYDAESMGTDDELIECLFAGNEARLWAKLGHKTYWMHLVFGKDGWDVLADYHVGLDPIIKGIFEWLDEQKEHKRAVDEEDNCGNDE